MHSTNQARNPFHRKAQAWLIFNTLFLNLIFEDIQMNRHTHRASIFAVFMAFFTFLIAAVAQAGVLFEDHFNDQSSLNNYTVKHGNAWIENQRLNLQGKSWPRDSVAILNGNPQWTNFELSIKVQPIAGWQHSKVFFRTQDFDWSSDGIFGKGYSVHLSHETGIGPYEIHPGEPIQFDWVEIYRQDCPASSSCQPNSVAHASFNALNVPVDLKILVNQGHIQVFLNGVIYLDYTDPNPLPAGGIGLGAVWETLATFDDLVVQDAGIPFASFTPRASVKLGPKSNDDLFNVSAKFGLGAKNNGIDPVAEDVTIKFGSFSTTIPAGKFQQQGLGVFTYKGTINKVYLKVEIHEPKGSSGATPAWFKPADYSINLHAKGANLDGMVLPPEVQLTIGDDTGSAKLDLGKGWFGKGKNGKHWLSDDDYDDEGHR
jgi:hypothetical protein